MAPRSSTLAWKIPWMEEPDRLQSMGSQRVRHDWATSFHFGAIMRPLWGFPHSSVGKESSCNAGDPGLIRVRKIPWRRKWQSTPALLPGKSHGWRSLIGYSPWGHKESDTTEWLHFLSDMLCKVKDFYRRKPGQGSYTRKELMVCGRVTFLEGMVGVCEADNLTSSDLAISDCLV